MFSLPERQVSFASCQKVLRFKMEGVRSKGFIDISVNVSSASVFLRWDYIAKVKKYG